MTDFRLIPILKSEGWEVMSRSKLKSMKKDELIETIETLENNYGATIERANNSYSYGKSEIERFEKENERLKADLEEARKHCMAVDDVNAKLKCCGNCNNARYEQGDRVIKGKCIKCNNLSEWELWEVKE